VATRSRWPEAPEYIWGAAWSLHEAGDPAAEDWVAVKALTVLTGGSDRAAAAITAEAGAAGLDGSRRSGAGAGDALALASRLHAPGRRQREPYASRL